MGVKRLASACTRAFDLNTIYGGGKEGQYKAVNGQGVAGVGKRGKGKCERYEHEIDYRLWDIGSCKSL